MATQTQIKTFTDTCHKLIAMRDMQGNLPTGVGNLAMNYRDLDAAGRLQARSMVASKIGAARLGCNVSLAKAWESIRNRLTVIDNANDESN